MAAPEQFSDAGLILVGHGSTKNASSAGPAHQHARVLRERRLFKEVRAGFWKEDPEIKEVLSQVKAERVFIVPLLVSEGYFSEQAIPQALGFQDFDGGVRARIQKHEGGVWLYCRPVGTHDRITDLLLSRADDVIARHPFPRAPQRGETSLIVAGHGTPRDARSRLAIEEQVRRIRERQVYAGVASVFLEEEPRVQEWHRLATTKHVVMIPFFMSEGLHADEDIPVLLGEPEERVKQRVRAGQPTWRNPTERQGKLLWYGDSVGTEPRIAELILDRVREAAGWA